MGTLQQKYKTETCKKLQEKFSYNNIHQIPKIDKIVLNVGAGEAVQNVKCLDSIQAYVQELTAQKPILCRAKKSIAGFKLREGQPIGVSVTLRREYMYDFLERLIHLALPRVRDFKGISRKGFDGKGNYSFGIQEQLIFPEVDFDKIDAIRGMNISIVTTAKTNQEALFLLEYLGLPFRKA